MAKRTFSPIPLASMQTAMGNPGFSDLANSDLGSDGTAADGFDSLLAQAISDVNAGTSVLSGLNLLFPAMDYSADPVQSPQWSSAVAQFAGIQAQADSTFAQTAQVLGSPSGTVSPPPTPKPVEPPVVTPPVHGGGGETGTTVGVGETYTAWVQTGDSSFIQTSIYMPPVVHQPLHVP